MNLGILKDINYGLDKVLSGKVEHLPQAKLVKKMVEDLIVSTEIEEVVKNDRSSL